MAIVSVRIDDDDLLERIDVLAKQNDRSRSGQIVAMARQALRSTAEVAASVAPPKADWFPYPIDQADVRIVEMPQSSVAGQGSPHPTYQLAASRKTPPRCPKHQRPFQLNNDGNWFSSCCNLTMTEEQAEEMRWASAI